MPGAYFRKRRYAGSKDRRAVTERLFDILRTRAKLDWWIGRADTPVAPSPRARVLADLVLRGEPAPESFFGGTTYAPAPLTPDEVTLAGALAGQTLDHPDMPAWVRGEFPDWLEEPLRALYGERLIAEMTALNTPAPVDVRINSLMGTRAQIQDLLSRENIAAQPSQFSPAGLRLEGHPRLTHTQAYKDGLIEVQDEGSQLAAFLVDAQPRHTVVDFCAGAGGKSLALVDAMLEENRFDGLLWACDVSEIRLGELVKRARRAGVHEAILIGSLGNDDPWLADNEGLADRVLLDVPCSGTGAWRREPEAKWRFTENDVKSYVSTQRDILTRAAALVRPGGRLIYVTCSILPSENEEQISWFIEQNQSFTTLPAGPLWQTVTGAAAPADTPFLRLSPAATDTDGFFIAVLERAL